MARYLLMQEILRDERRKRREALRRNFRLHTIPDSEFVNNYRLSRELFQTLCEEIVPFLPPRIRHRGIDPIMKILVVLNFYARGSYQGAVGLNSDVPMAQQTVSRCIHEVTDALNRAEILRKYIRFPQNREERNVIKQKFSDRYGIPGVCGCIDCTHIKIIRPAEHEERCFNRKHWHSINCQVICDSDCLILSIDASYGGATHDAFIWAQHEIKAHMEELSIQGETTYLLGDSGYPLRSFMMTPVDHAVDDSPEGRYNIIQKRARSTVERTFGILKGRWRCLLAARELHYTPETAGKIAIACSVLHNMCIHARLDHPELAEEDLAAENALPIPQQAAIPQGRALEEGRRVRRVLINLLEA
ncbi:hypothetical protein JYU34_002919 [Plutella xylostella]|nr:hypothetical protein JYU34_002919 [Plutella xylostella]